MSYFRPIDTTMDEEQVQLCRKEKLRCGCPGAPPQGVPGRSHVPEACCAPLGGGEGQGAPALGLGEENFTAQRVLPLLGCSETASLLTLLSNW